MSPAFVCFGELLLRLSAPGHERLLQSPHLQVFFGGAEANVAAALAGFGHSTAVVSALPDNPVGAATLASLRSQGIDTRKILTKPGRMGLYFYTQGAMQRPSEVIYDRAGSVFALTDPDEFDWESILANVSWFHVSGISAAVSSRGAESTLRALQVAARLGVRTSFDCNYRARVWGDRAANAPTVLRELCNYANLLFADDRDLTLILGGDANPARAFEEFANLQWIARTKRDAKTIDEQSYTGEIFSRIERRQSRTHDLSGIIERIGAGDAFAAGVLHQLAVDSANLQAAIEFGAAAGCYKHSLPGDVCIASIDDIQSLLGARSTDIKR